ncbi:MAG: hypothetical protein VB778_00165 [Nitrospinaceae bacterium]
MSFCHLFSLLRSGFEFCHMALDLFSQAIGKRNVNDELMNNTATATT